MLADHSRDREFLAHLTSAKAVSCDSDNNVHMTSSMATVVNFDQVVRDYSNSRKFSCVCSADAFYCDSNGSCYLIEFKNGRLDKGKMFEIKQKIYDSLLVLSDLTDTTLKDYRNELEFILVYNKEKNPDLFNAFPAPSNSPSLRMMTNGMAQKAKKPFKEESLESFERYCFKRVSGMSADEFERSILEASRSVWHNES